MPIHVVTTSAREDGLRLSNAQVAEVADILRLLGEPLRLRILLVAFAGPASVGEIALRAGVPRSLTSHHLRLLRASRFLRATRRGKQVIYSLADERVRCIVADLAAHVLDGTEER